jgi:hypothetical protein
MHLILLDVGYALIFNATPVVPKLDHISSDYCIALKFELIVFHGISIWLLLLFVKYQWMAVSLGTSLLIFVSPVGGLSPAPRGHGGGLVAPLPLTAEMVLIL